MTIASQTSRIAYTGDGSTTAFSVPFYFAANADLVVSVQDLSGNITTKVLGTDYNLTGATVSTGGTCTFVTAPTTNFKIAIYRVPQITQTTSYNNNDPFPAKSHENALDKTATIDQYLKSLIDRAILVAPTDNPPMTTLPPAAVRALKSFSFDALGNPTVTTPVTGSVVSAAMIPVTTASTLAIARQILGSTAIGDALYTAASAAAARTILGSGASGDALFLAATAAAARIVLGSGAFGDALFLTANAAAGRALLGTREGLTSARTYYVLSTGSNSNTGLVNTAGGAFLTIQKAWDTICDTLDLNGFNTRIEVGAGTFAGIATCKAPIGNSGTGCVTINGTGVATTFISTAGGNCIDVGQANGYGGAPNLTVSNMSFFDSIGGGNAINGLAGIIQVTNVEFGNFLTGVHIRAGHKGTVLTANYRINGSAAYHIYAYSNAFIATEGATTTIVSPNTFNTYAALLQNSTALMGGQTFVNKATISGQRYNVASSSMLTTGVGGATYLPGTTAGAVDASSYVD